MKAILFTGPSKSGWVHNFITEISKSLTKLNIDNLILDCNMYSFEKLKAVYDSYRPDWTFGINNIFPQYNAIDSGRTKIYELFKIQHYAYLVDNPYIWLTSDSIDFNSDYINVITIDNIEILENAGIKNCAEIIYGCPSSLRNKELENLDYKNLGLLFVGNIADPIKEAERINSTNNITDAQKKAVIDYCKKTFEKISSDKMFLKANLLTEFYYEASSLDIFDKNLKGNRQLLDSFMVVERFYESLARVNILKRLKSTNMHCVMAGGEAMSQFCGDADNFQFQDSVDYCRYLNMISSMCVNMNITPKHLHVHDRITSTLLSGSLLVTTPVPKLVDKFPILKDILVDVEFGENSFIDKIDNIVSSRSDYNNRVQAGAELAEKHFTWDAVSVKILEFINLTLK